MKIRQGFVSNSSSSSFVVMYENGEFQTWSDIKNAIKREYSEYHDGTIDHYGREVNINEVAKFLMRELVMNIESLDSIDGDEHDNLVQAVTEKLTDEKDYNDIIGPEGNWDKWDDFCNSCRDKAIKEVRDLSESHPGKTLMSFEFGDDTGIGSFLEHSSVISDIFDLVSKRSNH